jgi:hypothetical protein
VEIAGYCSIAGNPNGPPQGAQANEAQVDLSDTRAVNLLLRIPENEGDSAAAVRPLIPATSSNMNSW